MNSKKFKEKIGLNGDHNELGKDLKMFEFKGFVTAEISNIKDFMHGMKKELKDDIRENREIVLAEISKMKEQYDREIYGDGIRKGLKAEVNALKTFKSNVLLVVGLIAGGATIAANLLLGFFRLK